MKERIGDSAGAVWRVLHDNDKIELSALPKLVKQNESMAFQAVGWLAREDKIQYHAEGRKTFVALAPHEKQKKFR
jgi:hypothetical protein